MDNSFFQYLQKLELLVFFSGYPLVYTVCFFIAGVDKLKHNFIARLITCLPFAYALTGTLYLGLQLKNLYPDYSFENLNHSTAHPYLTAWGILSILFWIPAIAKRKYLSIAHSLVYFALLLNDLLIQSPPEGSVRNDMNVYTTSLLLNSASLLLVTLLSYLFTRNKKFPQYFLSL
jgi:hypothetical protein